MSSSGDCTGGIHHLVLVIGGAADEEQPPGEHVPASERLCSSVCVGAGAGAGVLDGRSGQHPGLQVHGRIPNLDTSR